jgi:hypothetical protein
MAHRSSVSAYIGVSAAYWAFMLSDGALRMLVLFHFHRLGFNAIELATLFVLYEVAGVITNLSAGWIAARFGLSSTLFSGLTLQTIALLMLMPVSDDLGVGVSLVYVAFVQGVSGVAKDLTKMSAKSAVKHLVPDADGQLFKWVAYLTGAKNAIKGMGFFVGAALLAMVGFSKSLFGMAIFLAIILITLAFKLPAGLPRGKRSSKFSDVFSKTANVNWLSLARVFLFAARDVWFVVALPVYLFTQSNTYLDNDTYAFFGVGAFMALWIIFYGFIQTRAPKLLGAYHTSPDGLIPLAQTWAFGLAAIPAVLALLIFGFGNAPLPIVVMSLFVFGGVFAINSSLHSYLILSFSDASRVSMNVGFYYMANAAGRLIGTLASGIFFQFGGLGASLIAATLFLTISGLAAKRLAA